MTRPRPVRLLLPLFALTLIWPLISCSPARDVSSPKPAGGLVSGTYAVEGITRPKGADEGRPIEGIVILVEEQDGYSSTFHLRSSYPEPVETSKLR